MCGGTTGLLGGWITSSELVCKRFRMPILPSITPHFALFVPVVVSPRLNHVRDVGSTSEYERRNEAQEGREIRFFVHSSTS